MAEDQKEDRWVIPINVGYENYALILRSLYQQNADSKPVLLDILTGQTGLSKPTIVSDMTFLKALGVVEPDSKNGYKLTVLGKDYSKAIFTDEKESLEKNSLEVINKSHLKSILDHIQVKKDITLESLYAFIKGQGRFTEGSGTTGMSAPYASGAKTVLRIFKDAKKLPENIDLDTRKTPAASTGSTPRPRPKSKDRRGRQGENYGANDSERSITSLARLTVPGIGVVDITNQDTFALAESFLELVKNKIESNKSSANEASKVNNEKTSE